MHDFGKLVYLDLHRTGSTFTTRFLRHSLILEEKKFVKHDWVRGDFNPHTFYFMTIRHPLAMYQSLYAYGSEGKGFIFQRLKQEQLQSVYKTFDHFVAFMLDENNAELLGERYSKKLALRTGFMSFRYLKLSLQYPLKKMSRCLEKNIALDDLESDKITDLIIKTEKLNDGLRLLSFELKAEFFDQKKANQWLNEVQPINASKPSFLSNIKCSKEISGLVERREQILLRHYE